MPSTSATLTREEYEEMRRWHEECQETEEYDHEERVGESGDEEPVVHKMSDRDSDSPATKSAAQLKDLCLRYKRQNHVSEGTDTEVAGDTFMKVIRTTALDGSVTVATTTGLAATPNKTKMRTSLSVNIPKGKHQAKLKQMFEQVTPPVALKKSD